jgi:hypothetical protein
VPLQNLALCQFELFDLRLRAAIAFNRDGREPESLTRLLFDMRPRHPHRYSMRLETAPTGSVVSRDASAIPERAGRVVRKAAFFTARIYTGIQISPATLSPGKIRPGTKSQLCHA